MTSERTETRRELDMTGLAVDQSVDRLFATTIETSIAGDILLVASSAGLCRVAFASEGHERILGDLTPADGVPPLVDDAAMAVYADAVVACLAGAPSPTGLPLDLRSVRGFQRAVLEHLRTILPGSTESYADVARAVGRPKAVRAVGTACATNPLPLVIPCHRVVRSDGTSGAYLGGAELKRTLLDLERERSTS